MEELIALDETAKTTDSLLRDILSKVAAK